jgi:alpha-galactosidase
MMKHDYTSFDLFGRWGSQMDSSPTRDGWKFADSSRTNAEIVTALYKTIRSAAASARLIGCNTFSHLSAGFHELQRIGDDTSGRSWNRNRRMGVNTLAFRGPQHNALYAVDPDIVAITKEVPWDLVQQWLTLVSESGAALFVAVEPSVIEPKHRTALKHALEIAARPQPVGEPLDWMATMCPRRWKLRDKTVEFAWMGDSGALPFPD